MLQEKDSGHGQGLGILGDNITTHTTFIGCESCLRFLQASSNQHHAQIQPYLSPAPLRQTLDSSTLTWKSQDGRITISRSSAYTASSNLTQSSAPASSSKMALTGRAKCDIVPDQGDPTGSQAPDISITK